MGNIDIQSLETKIGQIFLAASGEELLHVGLPNGEEEMKQWLRKNFPKQSLNFNAHSFFLKEVKLQICEYLEGERKTFTINYRFTGTPFQTKVWQQLINISYGCIVSYKTIGHNLGYKKGFQAIGQAVGNNPLAIIVPCHRVVGTNGSLTGYAGGVELKDFLLKHEKKHAGF